MQHPIVVLPCEAPHKRGRPRPRGSRRTRPSVLLRRLSDATGDVAHGVTLDAPQRIWFGGFCAGAASVAPERVKRCARCGEPFLAGDPREIYCGARCRNTVMQRRYRARLRARRRGLRVAG